MTPTNSHNETSSTKNSAPPVFSRAAGIEEEEERNNRGNSSKDRGDVSNIVYSKRINDATASSSSTHENVVKSSISLGSSSTTNMTVATNSTSRHHSSPSNWQHEYTDQQQEDLLGVKHHRLLQEEQEGERANCGTTTGTSSSTQRNHGVVFEHQKSIETFPSLDTGISEGCHAINAMNSSGIADLNSNKIVQHPHKPSQSFSNASKSLEDLGKQASKEQVKESIFEKMNAYFASKYNAQVSCKFPQKLFYIVDSGEYTHLIQWNEDGDAFQIKNVDSFVKDVLLHMFKQTKFESFHRKLNRWRFSKVRRRRSTWRHPFFQRGRLDLCTRIKEGSSWSSSALTKSNIKDDHINMKQEMLRNQQDQGHLLGIANQNPQRRSGNMMDRSNPTNMNDHPSSILPVASGFMPCTSSAPSQQLFGNVYVPLSGLNQHISNQPVFLSTIQNNIQYNNNQSLPAINQLNHFHQPTSFTDQNNISENQEMHNLTSTSSLDTTNNYVAIPVQALVGNMPNGLLQNATGNNVHDVGMGSLRGVQRQQSDMGLTAQSVDIQEGWEGLPQEQELNSRYNADGNLNINYSTITTAYSAQRDDNDDAADSDQHVFEK